MVLYLLGCWGSVNICVSGFCFLIYKLIFFCVHSSSSLQCFFLCLLLCWSVVLFSVLIISYFINLPCGFLICLLWTISLSFYCLPGSYWFHLVVSCFHLCFFTIYPQYISSLVSVSVFVTMSVCSVVHTLVFFLVSLWIIFLFGPFYLLSNPH